LDADLIEMNMDGRLLDRIVGFAEIVTILSQDNLRGLIDLLLVPTAQPNGRLQQTRPEMVIAVLMRVAGLINADSFHSDRVVCVDALSRFVTICRENQTVVEEALGEPLRVDLELKPVRQLNLFLRRIGLKLTPVKTQKVAGRKIRYYRIPAELLATMTRLSRSYLEIRARTEEDKALALGGGRKRRSAAPSLTESEPVRTDDGGLLSPSILDSDP
jgi:hypothetical protein